MLVVILTDEGAPPRAVGPFDDWDAAQASANALVEQWQAESGDAPDVTVAHVEEPNTGVVVGEIQ